MKIAVCISGLFRGMEICLPTWRTHLLNSTDQFDAFVCTGPNTEWCNYTSSLYMMSKLKELFNSTTYVIEHDVPDQFPGIIEERNFNKRNKIHVMSMFSKIKTANDLKIQHEQKYGFIYDVVIRWRPDTYLKSSIALSNEDKLFVPKHGDFGGLNDQMAWSNSKNMDHYSNLYSKITDYLNEDKSLTFNPELLTKRHWEKLGKPLQRPNVMYQLARDNSNMLPDNETRERIQRESNGTRNL